jgi:hypothetical protein
MMTNGLERPKRMRNFDQDERLRPFSATIAADA